MNPHALIRVSDAEREAVVGRLRAATADGRLTLEEFSDRVRRVYESRTNGELALLVGDLPAPFPPNWVPPTPFPPNWGPPTQWAQPVPPPPNWVPPMQWPQPARRTSTRALLAMIFGVLSLPIGAAGPLGILFGPAGAVLGILGLRDARRSGSSTDRNMALAGLICGSIGTVLGVLLLTLFL
jgi:hypothetical protein